MWLRAAFLGVLCVASACARSTSVPPGPVVDVSGSWEGTWTTDDRTLAGDVRMELKQDDATVTGVMLMTGMIPGPPGIGPGQPGGYIDGTVKDDELSFSRGRMTALLKVRGDTMRGSLSGLASPTTVDVHRVGR
jgi:hypothetical protein